MYYQVTSRAAREEVFISYSLTAYANGRPAERPALEVRIATGRDAPLARRLTTITLD